MTWLCEVAGVAKGLLVIYESGFQAYREYILETLAKRYKIWLFSSRTPSWELPYLFGYSKIDTYRVPAAIAEARRLAGIHQVDGILCYDELHIVVAASVAEDLGLPGPSRAAVTACRDKHLGRRLLERASVPQPRSHCVRDVTDAARAAEHLGYPVIVKPRNLAGSVGVSLVHDRAGLQEAAALVLASGFPGVQPHGRNILVEEFVSGPEISIDCLVWEGEAMPVFVAHKSQELAPTFEETGHLISGGDPLLTDESLRDVLLRIHKAIGFSSGTSHVELRQTPAGPKVIEVNGRFGGDLIPYLGWLASGIDLPAAAAELVCGRPAVPVATRNCSAAIRWLYPPHDMVFTGAETVPAAFPPGLFELRVLAQPGQKLALPPRQNVFGRVALVIAIGQTREDCHQTLSRAPESLVVQGKSI
jgi:biotin carboxylase